LGALRREAPRTGGQRVGTGYALNESLSSTRRGIAAKAAANGVLDLTRLGDSIKVTAERVG
jgi:hypothetical protein